MAKRVLAAFALLAAMAGCAKGSLVEPTLSGRGDLYIKGLDPATAERWVEFGAERATHRTAHPEKLPVRYDGLGIVRDDRLVGTNKAGYYEAGYSGLGIIHVRPGYESVIEHELQHYLAHRVGLKGVALTLQDHPGGYDLDGHKE